MNTATDQGYAHVSYAHHAAPVLHPPSKKRVPILMAGAVLAFHLAYAFPGLSFLVILTLAALFDLKRASSSRKSFYAGVLAGLGIYAPQLAFFWGIFGFGAIALWTVLAFWIGLFVLLAHLSSNRFHRWIAALTIPFLWLGIEYFRSELYYLRFAWLTPGFAFSHSPQVLWLAWMGVYGIGFVLMLAISLVDLMPRRYGLSVGAIALVISGILSNSSHSPPSSDTQAETHQVAVAGVQLEFPSLQQIHRSLDILRERFPAAELLVLSEYTLDGLVPESLKQWCRDHNKYLIIGGKNPSGTSNFYDTAFVVGPSGKIVFEQAKVVPIQFFQDGLPAPRQAPWHSPWGKIGICICYDLSYSRATDELIRQGAQALIVPTMDLLEWGKSEHELHSRVAPMRAAEYAVPIFRLASSGISQHIGRNGTELASAPFPGEGEMIAGSLALVEQGRLPIDRILGPFAVLVTGLIIAYLALFPWGRKYLKELSRRKDTNAPT